MADPSLVQALIGGGAALAVWGAQALTYRLTHATRKGAVALLQDAAIGLAWFSPTPRETLIKVCEVKKIPLPPSHYVERVFYRLDRCYRLTHPPHLDDRKS
jgi:hypothetical protein